uniref:Uncharacterized protein n=1 Tax=Lepeophtheirus salmonis TaxID=72036 RepID=A0A0K2V9W2_LEPSM
MNPHECSIRF